MLVLSRKPRSSIRIGLDIEVTVLEIHNGQVRLGISAPPHVAIVRDNCRSTHANYAAEMREIDKAVDAAVRGETCTE